MTFVVDWAEERDALQGVVERPFSLRRGRGDVPGILWLPAGIDAAAPLVLLGHGGSGHKRTDRILRLARWFATEHGMASAAIDGPYHGERARTPLAPADYQARIIVDGLDEVVDRMVDDWRAVVSSLAATGVVDTTRVGYLGMSMGARFGLPLAAATGSMLRCGVFGKFGLRQARLPFGMNMTARIRAEAGQIVTPLLFHIQWHDELFPRDGQLALFDLFASGDKQVAVHSGRHGETTEFAVDSWRRFIAARLTN